MAVWLCVCVFILPAWAAHQRPIAAVLMQALTSLIGGLAWPGRAELIELTPNADSQRRDHDQ